MNSKFLLHTFVRSFFILSFGLFMSFFTTNVYSQATMSNDQYKIKLGILNSGSGKTSDTNYRLDTNTGQVAPGIFKGENYIVKSGFQYLEKATDSTKTSSPGSSTPSSSITPFSFQISSQFIDFGPIVPGSPVTRTNLLTVASGSSPGYSILVSANHPLRQIPTAVDIPDTTCDFGTCSEHTSSLWQNLLTYGFGYRCDNISGNDCADGFTGVDYFKQFANSEAKETAQAVMEGNSAGTTSQSQITYKVNIASSQKPGLYGNTLTFLALPSL